LLNDRGDCCGPASVLLQWMGSSGDSPLRCVEGIVRPRVRDGGRDNDGTDDSSFMLGCNGAADGFSSVTGPGSAGRDGGFLVPSKDANPALVILRNNCEPASCRNLPSFLSVVIWSVSGGSRKIVAAKLVFKPFCTPYGGTGHIRLFLLSKEVLLSRKLSSALIVSDSLRAPYSLSSDRCHTF
jgi:hypothetical protein